MAHIAERTTTEPTVRRATVPAVEVVDLRKEFRRRDRKRGRSREATVAGAPGRRRSRSSVASASPILGQNGSGKSTLVRLLSTLLLHDGGDGAASSATTPSGDTRAVRRLVNRVSVEASFFKKMSAAENLATRRASTAWRRVADARPDPGDPRDGRLPGRPPRRADGEPLARHAAEGRARTGAADVSCPAAARRADDGPRPALEARGAGVHPRVRRRTTPPSSSARTTWRRRRRSPTASASSTAAGCSCLEPADDAEAPLRRRDTLEEAFFAATGREYVRGRKRRRRRVQGGVRMRADAATMRSELIGLGGVVERNVYLTQALLLVGRRVLRLDGREHAHDRVHRQGHRGGRRRIDVERAHDPAADRGGRSGPTSGSSSSSSRRRSPGSAGRARSSTRSWPRCRGRCTWPAWASSRSSTASSARRSCSSPSSRSSSS